MRRLISWAVLLIWTRLSSCQLDSLMCLWSAGAGCSRRSLPRWPGSPPHGVSSSMAVAGVWERTNSQVPSVFHSQHISYCLIWPKQITWSCPESVWEGTTKGHGHWKVYKSGLFKRINLLWSWFNTMLFLPCFPDSFNLRFQTPDELWKF